jgi:cellulose synthase/poly-beta-1,6-N-acetylglucosamine synthase-like glycosyltransferase
MSPKTPDLGFRLAREGYRAHMIAPPTYEEAPVGFSAWLNQRTRRIKGHLQTYLVLMRNPFALARELGLSGFIALHMTLRAGLAGAFLHGPLFVFLLASALTHWNSLSTPISSWFCAAIAWRRFRR